MSIQVVRRFRRCVVCDLAATENSDLCAECLADEEWRLRFELPVVNFESCRVCGAELSRHGHCFDCAEVGWSPAQVREGVTA